MYSKILKATSWILMIISVILLIWGSVTGFEANGGKAVDVLLRWGYILLIVAVAAVLIAAIAVSVKNNPKSLIKALIALVVIVALCYVVYAISSTEMPAGYLGEAPSAGTLKLTSALLNITYILFGCAFAAIIIGELVRASRNK